jgi:hypothetical protein
MNVRITRVLVNAILPMAILAGAGHAQARPLWVLLMDGEVAFPVGGPDGFLEKYESVSFGGGAGLALIITKQLTALARFGYTRLSVDEEGFRLQENLPDDTAFDGGDIDMLYISAGARYYPLRNPPRYVKPYVVGSAGWFHIESDTLIASSSVLGTKVDTGGSESAFGASVGVGSDFPITPTVSAFFEAEYQVGFTSGATTATVPIRLGFVFILSSVE